MSFKGTGEMEIIISINAHVYIEIMDDFVISLI